VGEHELQALEVGDPLAEGLALLDVAEGEVERTLRDADRLGTDRDAGVVEGAQGVLETLTRVADQVLAGDADVVEEELPGRRSLDAHLLLLLAEGEALLALLEDEGGDVAPARAVGVGHGEHGVELG